MPARPATGDKKTPIVMSIRMIIRRPRLSLIVRSMLLLLFCAAAASTLSHLEIAVPTRKIPAATGLSEYGMAIYFANLAIIIPEA
jgi:hypothetical protein